MFKFDVLFSDSILTETEILFDVAETINSSSTSKWFTLSEYVPSSSKVTFAISSNLLSGTLQQ